MVFSLNLLPEYVATFLLIFARIGTIMMLLPGFGHTAISPNIKLLIAAFISLSFLPLLQADFQFGTLTISFLLLSIGWEFMIGIFLGTAVRLTLHGIQVAGSVIAHQTNLAAIPGYDASSGEQGVIVSSFFAICIFTLIFVLNLHHMMIIGMLHSYKMMPPGEAFAVGDFTALVVDLVADGFLIGAQIASPFIVLGIIMQAGLGILSRLMPQFQVFFVAIPLTIFAGLALLFSIVGVMLTWYVDYMQKTIDLILGA